MINASGFSRPEDSNSPMLLVHGGAWNIPDEECDAHRSGLLKVLQIGKKSLLGGKNALDVVAEVVAGMESDGAFDAGVGAVLTRDATVELDAGIMQGEDILYGAVSGVKHFANPVNIAKMVLEKGQRQYCFLSGSGAENFARDAGFLEVTNDSLICDREMRRYELLRKQSIYHTSHPFLPGKEDKPRGTVGCVALDKNGRLAAATSTGGTPYRIAGRIGDSPMPGSGYYANEMGASSATGWGEAIASVSMCYEAVRLLGDKTAEVAALESITLLNNLIKNEDGAGATGGIILLSKRGAGGFAFSTPRMARGGWCEGGELWAEV
ncbi:MAG: isoaspartyl peptidase/L-asparaginase family protein [Rhodothermales bacterium]